MDNRHWCGPGHPAAAYFYSEDRRGDPQTHLRGFRGLLQVDGGACPWAGLRPDPRAGFGGLVSTATDNAPQLAVCWAHVRRKFYDIHAANPSPLAEEPLRRMAALYEIEADIRATPAEHRSTAIRYVEPLQWWLLDHARDR